MRELVFEDDYWRPRVTRSKMPPSQRTVVYPKKYCTQSSNLLGWGGEFAINEMLVFIHEKLF